MTHTLPRHPMTKVKMQHKTTTY